MKRIVILLALVVVSGFIAGEEAFAFSEPPTKDEKQFMSALFLTGFVGIYAIVIYLRKSSEIEIRN
ncbi:MAG TPA: hypothetical protein VLA01_01860 [Nitrosopumilaceae archaeon]|nr:hypothetical protein [Nitrosopumilaceae archaeon]